jgi:putative phosphoribosyl transferase
MTTRDLRIPCENIELVGTLTMPDHAIGLVIFAHGSGSNRHSPRNTHVARILESKGLATLLVDLHLPDDCGATVDTLARRLVAATDNVIANGAARGLPIAYFGSSNGAAAALIAAACRPSRIAAIVSRGGKLELAAPVLDQVHSPTLLIVGSNDHAVRDENCADAAKLHVPLRFEIVPDADHLFDEPGALDQVGELAAAWFIQQFASAAASEVAQRRELAP